MDRPESSGVLNAPCRGGATGGSTEQMRWILGWGAAAPRPTCGLAACGACPLETRAALCSSPAPPPALASSQAVGWFCAFPATGGRWQEEGQALQLRVAWDVCIHVKGFVIWYWGVKGKIYKNLFKALNKYKFTGL